ncbi:MAG: nitrogen regulation protein NR(II), partial [Candidatus Korobacteraceae bacterium]
LNERQAEIVGLPREQILGRGLTEIAPIEGLDDMFRQVAAGRPIKNALLEGELPMRPGEHRYWTVNYDPVYAPDGTLQAITAASLEITSQKRAEAALIQSEKLAAVGRLASSIAHEINNPLEAITNLLFLLERSQLPEEAKRFVTTAQSELNRVSHITLQTLRFHRQSIHARELDPATILDEVLSLFQRQIQEAKVTVQRQYHKVKPIIGYEQDLRQVFINFVENALDAIRSDGNLILCQRQGKERHTGRSGVRITIADDGHGMSAEIRRRIFEPFFTTKETTGTGLGLWVSSEILKKHQGVVRVRSSKHSKFQGTVFTLFFPYDAFPAAGSDPAPPTKGK